MTFPGTIIIPSEALTYLPWYVVGGIVTIIVIVWLVQAVVGLVKALNGWRKDENTAKSVVRVERARELADSIAQARDARAAEARWYGQYLAQSEEMAALKVRMAALGTERDALALENGQNAYRLRLHRAFMASAVVSEHSKASWAVFLDAEKHAAEVTEPSLPVVGGRMGD